MDDIFVVMPKAVLAKPVIMSAQSSFVFFVT